MTKTFFTNRQYVEWELQLQQSVPMHVCNPGQQQRVLSVIQPGVGMITSAHPHCQDLSNAVHNDCGRQPLWQLSCIISTVIHASNMTYYASVLCHSACTVPYWWSPTDWWSPTGCMACSEHV